MVRIKQRYILCEIILDPAQTAKKLKSETQYDVYKSIKDSVQLLYGDHGYGLIQRSLSVKYVNCETKVALIRVQRGTHQMTLQALAFVKKIGSIDAFFKTLHVSGTIRSSQKFLVKYQKQELIRLVAQCNDRQEKKNLRKLLKNCEQNMKGNKKGDGRKKKCLIPIDIDTEDEVESGSD